MKFTKIFALVLAVCMLGTMMIACSSNIPDGKAPLVTIDLSGRGTEEVETSNAISVTLVIKNGSGAEVANEIITYSGENPTLGEILSNYCAAHGYEEPFDENELLSAIGELTPGEGEYWIAYYESEGKNEAFDSIKNQPVANGEKVIVAID